MLKPVISYLERFVIWLWRGCLLFSGPLIAIGLPLLAACLLPTEFSFRLVGFVLQVLGVWIVWIGIRGTRAQFEVPGSIAQTKEWLTSFPRFRGRASSLSGTAYTSVSASGRLDIWSRTPEGASLEQRVNVIEKNLRRVHDDLSAHQSAVDTQDRRQRKEMERERYERKAADQEIHDKIKETETGSLKLNAAGVWWLLSGTICSTFPEEIARVVGAS